MVGWWLAGLNAVVVAVATEYRINTSHDDLHARTLDLSLRRDEPKIRRDHAIFGILLKLLDESLRPVGPRWPKKEEQK
jgi:hypothetical protein